MTQLIVTKRPLDLNSTGVIAEQIAYMRLHRSRSQLLHKQLSSFREVALSSAKCLSGALTQNVNIPNPLHWLRLAAPIDIQCCMGEGSFKSDFPGPPRRLATVNYNDDRSFQLTFLSLELHP